MKQQEKEFVGGWVDKRLKRKLKAMAKAEERPLNYVLEKILREGVNHPVKNPS